MEVDVQCYLDQVEKANTRVQKSVALAQLMNFVVANKHMVEDGKPLNKILLDKIIEWRETDGDIFDADKYLELLYQNYDSDNKKEIDRVEQKEWVRKCDYYIATVDLTCGRKNRGIAIERFMEYLITTKHMVVKFERFNETLFKRLIELKADADVFNADKYLAILFPEYNVDKEKEVDLFENLKVDQVKERTTLIFIDNVQNTFTKTIYEMNFLEAIKKDVLGKSDKPLSFEDMSKGSDGLYLVKLNEVYELYEKVNIVTKNLGYIYNSSVTNVQCNKLGVYGQV